MLYVTSGVAGVALAIAAFFSPILTPPLLLLAALIGVLVSYFKEREVNAWLEKSYFGIKATSERFEGFDEEKKAFSAIFS